MSLRRQFFRPLTSSLIRYAIGLTLALCAVGCTRVALQDDVDLVLDFAPLLGPSDALHGPYVEGSSMNIYVVSSSSHEHYTGWSLVSSAPDIFAVGPLTHKNDDDAPMSACHALRPGVSNLVVLDGQGSVVAEEQVEVRRPDEIRFLAHGLLLVDYPDDAAWVHELRVLSGGTATYLARYYAGGVELHGNGSLTAVGTSEVGAQVLHSFLFEDRDWLQISPQASSTVALSINGTPFSTVPITTVTPDQVASVRILGQDESQHKDGDWLVAYAQASDALGSNVYGVEYQWELAQVKQTGLGDLFRYQYRPKQPQVLTARFQSMAAQTNIHADKGFVDSTNNVGCSAGLHAKPSATPISSLLGLSCLLLVMRRRRRA